MSNKRRGQRAQHISRAPKPAFFYGWWIVFLGFMLMAVSFSIIMSCHSLFVLPVSQSLGISRGEFTLTLTLVGLSAAASSAWVGKVLSRSKSLKRSMTLFVLWAGLVFAAFSAARATWHFYALAVLLGPGFVGSSNLAGSLLVNQWFVARRGFALGLVAAGSGIGTALLSPIITKVIVGWGWQMGYLFSGALILLICLPLVTKLATRSPSDAGLSPLGLSPNSSASSLTDSQSPTNPEIPTDPQTSAPPQASPGSIATPGLTLSELKAMPAFWLFFVTMFLLCVVIGGSQLTIVAYFREIGYTAEFAALMFSVQALGMLVGKLSLGAIFDWLGARGGILIATAALAITMVGYLNAAALPIALASSILIGMAASMSTVGNAYLTGSFFGSKDFGNVYGLVNITMITGATTGPLVTNLIYDRTGSYSLAWMGFLVLILLCGVSLIYLQKVFYVKLVKAS
ncbi:MFS transporter [Acidaminobacter hydrogenoformans]|uniref:Sugar phosphate permease n=1 Tax=Acidaminobacter hydrogenoformans DSM 2784 TaxID=1120920 RepID=A0A1G5RZU1_9FIRM|nr:MFS transporter [Acidaminobacter hydrogenoformans]SCZ79634.1 Sugar phosphate permease [Acidaminobacter hydrogenoformans DSM 2784]